MYIDTHAHLDTPEFKHKVGAAIGHALENGVGKIINVGVDLKSSKDSIDLSRRYPEIYAAIGIHPEAANELDIETKTELLELAYKPKVIAIGEIGLDYYYLKRSSQYASYPKREVQIFCLEQMLDLAVEVNLPVILHCREAETDLLAVLKSYGGTLRGVVHCFSGAIEFAEKILDLGLAISFTGNITFKNSRLDEVIKKIPIGSIMLETDSPLLAPEPFRGQVNEPAHVIEIAKKIAKIKDLPLALIESETTKKAEKVFKLK